eukprot:TRINITY_DN27222_c0_g1_i1.p1 TRINITY_DN27222_c0_g1~~TRINITY_DN27222_c0_g1_i1.p1  ORF type:complete len:296 (-),score=69.10 TRINITY_DN27222_c0_g1_i1:227-1114(-)
MAPMRVLGASVVSAYLCHAAEASIPKDLEKMMCKYASEKEIEDHATSEICEKIHATHPYIGTDICVARLDRVWDMAVTKECQHGAVDLKGNRRFDMLKKLVCEFASKKDIENHATEKVCEKIHARQPEIPVGDCAILLERVWDDVVAKCPKDSSDGSDLAKKFCEIATKKEIEDAATAKICSKLHSAHPEIPAAECQAGLERIWDMAVDKTCGKSPNSMPQGSLDKWLMEIFCKFASQKEIEDRATSEICEKIHGVHPDVQIAECKQGLDRIWDMVVAKKCPHHFMLQKVLNFIV